MYVYVCTVCMYCVCIVLYVYVLVYVCIHVSMMLYVLYVCIYMLIYGLCVANMRCAYIKACNNKGMYRMWAHITALYNTVGYIDTVYISMGI